MRFHTCERLLDPTGGKGNMSFLGCGQISSDICQEDLWQSTVSPSVMKY